MGPFISWGLCLNRQKNQCLTFWLNMEGSGKYRATLVKVAYSNKRQHNTQTMSAFVYFCIFPLSPFGTQCMRKYHCIISVVCVSAKKLFSFLFCRIFLSLMEAAGLTDLLKQEGEFTLFAPSDKSFAAWGERDLEFLKSKSFKLSSSFKGAECRN